MDPADSQAQRSEYTAQGIPPSGRQPEDTARINSAAAARHDNTFTTPSRQTSYSISPGSSNLTSRPGSIASTTAYQGPPRSLYFKSRRVKKEEIEKPWLDKPDPREKWATICPLAGLFLGLIIVGLLIWDGIRSVEVHKYCEVFSDNFTSWNDKVWTKEVEVGGFG